MAKNTEKVKKSPTSSQININVHHVQTFFTMNTTKNLKMNVATAMKSLLEQGKENRISPLAPREAIPPFLTQCCVDPETEEQVRSLCGLADAVLSAYPVWKFVNLGDAASTELLRQTILQRSGG